MEPLLYIAFLLIVLGGLVALQVVARRYRKDNEEGARQGIGGDDMRKGSICPICFERFENADEEMAHFEEFHQHL